MFIENLTDGEKAAFLGLAKLLVEADEVLSPKETQLLSSLSDAAGVDAVSGSLKELAGAFQTRQSKASAMLEMMGLGLADGEYHPAEAALMAEFSNALGFTEDELLWMESWIVRQVSLVEEAANFMSQTGKGEL